MLENPDLAYARRKVTCLVVAVAVVVVVFGVVDKFLWH